MPNLTLFCSFMKRRITFINVIVNLAMSSISRPEPLLTTFTKEHKKWVLKQISLFQHKCFKVEIQLSRSMIMQTEVRISFATFAGPIALNRFLASVVISTGAIEEGSTRANVLDCLKKSLDDVYEILEDFKSLAVDVDKIGQVKYERSKFLKFICRNNFAKGLIECLSSHDSSYINKFKYDSYRILCKQLGLKEEICNYLPDGKMLTHKSALEWFVRIIERNYEILEEESDTMLVLQKLGFTESVASYLANWIDKNKVLSHKSILHWATYFLNSFYDAIYEYAGKKDEFPFEHKLGHFYDGIPVEGGSETFKILGVNEEFNEGKSHDITKTLRALIDQKLKPEQGEKFWFHGTNLDAEESIRKIGIDLSFGKAGDFSKNGNGFYLAADLSHALDYAKTIKKRKFFSVLVFKVHDNFRRDFRRGRDLRGDDPLWIRATDYYHNYQRRMQMREPSELRNVWYVEGKTSRYENLHQLCIRNDDLAAYFLSKLVCVFYFRST